MSFQYPAMLWWGLAACIPLALHWLTRRTPRTVRWSAMPLLLQAVSSHTAYAGRLRHRIILALRTLALLVLAVALADPRCDHNTSNAHKSLTNHHRWIFVFDTSPSNGYQQITQSRIQRAATHARQLLKTLPPHDRIAVVAWQDTPILLGESFNQRELAESLIAQVQIDPTSARWDTLFPFLKDLVNRRTHSGPTTITHVVIYSDLAPQPWIEFSLPTLQFAWNELTAQCQIHVIQTSDEPQIDNLGIIACTSIDPIVVSGEPFELNITIAHEANYAVPSTSQANVASSLLEVWLDDKLINQQNVEVPWQGKYTQRIAYRSPSIASPSSPDRSRATSSDVEATYRLRCQLRHDQLLDDNVFHAILTVRPPVRVLCVGDTGRVAAALNPKRSRHLRFEVDRIDEESFTTTLLTPYDVIALAGLSDISPIDQQRLVVHLQQGKGILWFCDQTTDVTSLPYYKQSPESGFLPATYDTIAEAPAAAMVFPAGNHPCWESFRDNPTAGLLDAPIFRYRKIRPVAGIATHSLLEFATGDPCVIVSDLYAGRIAMIATSASEAVLDHNVQPPIPWSLWSTWPSFPPSLHQLVSYVAARKAQPAHVPVGDTLSWPLAIEATIVPATVQHESGDPTLPVHVVSADHSVSADHVNSASHRCESSPATKPGFYRAIHSPQPTASNNSNRPDARLLGDHWFAVNVAPEECQVTPIPWERIPATVRPQVLQLHDPFPSTQKGVTHQIRPTTFRIFLGALLAFLVGETWLVSRTFT